MVGLNPSPEFLRMFYGWFIIRGRKLQHSPIHKRNKKYESATAKVCFDFLDKTGRSFSSVVKELHPSRQGATP